MATRSVSSISAKPLAQLGLAALICLSALGVQVGVADAAADPAISRIASFDGALLEAMKSGRAVGAKGRYHRLTPVVEASFDLPLMTRFSVGPVWAKMSEADHQALTQAFTRLSAASYAHNFDTYGGEKFVIDPAVTTRGLDKIVQTHIVPAKGAPTALTYRMRETPGGWKIVDVYYGSISQLTTRRSDFAASVASGGAKALLAHLDGLTAKLLD